MMLMHEGSVGAQREGNHLQAQSERLRIEGDVQTAMHQVGAQRESNHLQAQSERLRIEGDVQTAVYQTDAKVQVTQYKTDAMMLMHEETVGAQREGNYLQAQSERLRIEGDVSMTQVKADAMSLMHGQSVAAQRDGNCLRAQAERQRIEGDVQMNLQQQKAVMYQADAHVDMTKVKADAMMLTMQTRAVADLEMHGQSVAAQRDGNCLRAQAERQRIEGDLQMNLQQQKAVMYQ